MRKLILSVIAASLFGGCAGANSTYQRAWSYHGACVEGCARAAGRHPAQVLAIRIGNECVCQPVE